MSKSLFSAARVAGQSWSNGVFVAPGDTNSYTTEAQRAFRIRKAGTIADLAININGTGTARSVKVRKNAADGNGVVSPADAASGWFGDTTHTDSVSAGDDIDLSVAHTGSDPTAYCAKVSFAASSGHVALYQAVGSQNIAVNRWSQLHGFLTGGGSTSTNQNLIRVAGTIDNLHCYVTVNGAGSTTAVTLYKGASATALSASITAGATGLFEDTSNSVSVASGDLVNYGLLGISGALTFVMAGCHFTATSGTSNDVFANSTGNAGVSVTVGTNQYFPISGVFTAGVTTRTQADVKHGFAATLTRARCQVPSTNTASTNVTGTLMINGSAGNNTFTVTAGATGTFEDTTNSDTVTDTDLVCIELSGGTSGAITVVSMAVTEQWNAPAGGGSAKPWLHYRQMAA